MSLNLGRFFRACNPRYTLNISKPEDRQYYIDFAPVRGSNVIRELKRTITFSDHQPTCQLFTGHIGCGKSTELSRLKTELEAEKFHVVYFESSQDLDMADVDISDILLAIARQVSQSLENSGVCLQPKRFQGILKSAANLLNTEITSFRGNIPVVGDIGVSQDSEGFSLAFGIGEITAKAKDSRDVRSLLRQHLEPRVNNIIEVINQELITPAQQQLQQRGQGGLVVIIDNLDRIDNKAKFGIRTQPEYLFVDRGEQLNKLLCHVIYTIPLILTFSNDKEAVSNRFGSPAKLLPMVRVKERDGSDCEPGINLLRQMVLARAFPELNETERLREIPKLFDSTATLDYLCQMSGGHVRNLLILLFNCLQKDDPPFTRTMIERVISERRNELGKAITPNEWELLRQVSQHKTVRGEEEYQTLLRSLFVFEYCDHDGSWFDLNPVLEGAKDFDKD
ncbi:MAG: ATP-binding protein [Arthrospira sp. SH-MAG29]|nr:ATP-binding protein [Arthrospira sp. SH-MAG29]MBS0017860.1 ATP-binding protein [Arthrospira sp. SH-MAG29]